MSDALQDSKVQAGHAASPDERWYEPFNKAVREACRPFGYCPTNDTIDALKRDFEYAPDYGPMADYLRKWEREKREGKDSSRMPPDDQWVRSLTALMLCVRDIALPGGDEIFALSDVVEAVAKLKEKK